MNRLDRLTAILIHLQSKRVVRAQELADRFGISLRTVYRDVRALEAAGVPIGAEAGVGYFLEDYHLPPVMLTNAEASALLFGAKLVEKWGDASLREPYESALFKIKSVLKRPEKDHLDELSPQIAVSALPGASPFSEPVLNQLQAAIVRQRVLRLYYRSPYDTAPTQRDVQPIGLYHYSAAWHLIAYCRLRQDYRDFRTDRIEGLAELPERFSRQNLLTLQTYLDGLRRTEALQEAVVWFDKAVARFAQLQKFGYGFVDETEENGRVRMHFLTGFLRGLAHWLLMYGNSVTVESPPELRESLRELTRELHEHYFPEPC
jgi:predicted DNA-binding transcriptional regulator YafY